METLVRLNCNLPIITFVVSLLPPLPSLFLPFLLTSLSKYLLPFYFFYQKAIRNAPNVIGASELTGLNDSWSQGGVRKLATFWSWDDMGTGFSLPEKGGTNAGWRGGKLEQSLWCWAGIEGSSRNAAFCRCHTEIIINTNVYAIG